MLYSLRYDIIHRPWGFLGMVRRWLLPFRPSTEAQDLTLISSSTKREGEVRVMYSSLPAEEAAREVMAAMRDFPSAARLMVYVGGGGGEGGRDDVTLVRCRWRTTEEAGRRAVALIATLPYADAENRLVSGSEWQGEVGEDGREVEETDASDEFGRWWWRIHRPSLP